MPRRQASTGQRTQQRSPAVPWKAGDILYLKAYADHSEVYEDAGIADKIPDHPAVLLYRPSSDSEYMVLALMTSLRGKTLETHWLTSTNKKACRRFVPIEPAPVNPENGMKMKMEPFPSFKTSFINTGEIFTLPGKVLNRFGDSKGHNYSLNPESFRELMAFVGPSSKFHEARKIAKEREVARQALIATPTVLPEVSSAELFPGLSPLAARSPLFVNDIIPETAQVVGQRTSYASLMRESPSGDLDTLSRYGSRADVARPLNSRPIATVPRPLSNRPVATSPMPGTYPDWTTPVQFPIRSAARSAGYHAGSSLERGAAERQPLLRPANYQRTPEGDDGSYAGYVGFTLLLGAGVLYFTGAWSYITKSLWP